MDAAKRDVSMLFKAHRCCEICILCGDVVSDNGGQKQVDLQCTRYRLRLITQITKTPRERAHVAKCLDCYKTWSVDVSPA